jgi:peptidoglycan/xylan/chitin deacetylase (PgdA/CDA1 family)
MAAEIDVKVSPWYQGKQWVYSITFDEALADLEKFSIPILEEFGVPGHVEVVVGQIGQIRKLCASSYNGMRHMNAIELQGLLDRGWGVGLHSWSHTILNAANLEWEIRKAKQVLEQAIEHPVTVYSSPGDNYNMADEILEYAYQNGILGAMAVFEALNRPDDADLMWLNRVFLHDQGPNTHETEFDPFRKIAHARRDLGWVIDYLHCPLEEPVHPRKDCSAAHLRERVATVVAEGGEDVWLARVEEPMDYRYLRRHVQIQPAGPFQYRLRTPGLPAAVHCHKLTLELPANTRQIDIDGTPGAIYRHRELVLADIDLAKERTVRIYCG